MANLTGKERARYVQSMFSQIAQRYDLLNRLMTAGQDISWRREAIHRTGIQPMGKLLDLGAGTGDLSMEAIRQAPGLRPFALDFTLAMMQTGRQRPMAEAVLWSAGDALSLPFPAETFDAVVSGFLLRNVADVNLSLREQVRVLKPGGVLVALDTTHPRESLLSPFMRFHMEVIIPMLGNLIARQPEAYRYLPSSTEGFLSAEQLAARMISSGLQEVGFHLLMFGAAAIHWGVKAG